MTSIIPLGSPFFTAMKLPVTVLSTCFYLLRVAAAYCLETQQLQQLILRFLTCYECCKEGIADIVDDSVYD